MTDIGRVARAHDDAICAALSGKERASLWSMLSRIADEQKLTVYRAWKLLRAGRHSLEGKLVRSICRAWAG